MKELAIAMPALWARKFASLWETLAATASGLSYQDS
jgi:hypothetical protein